MGLDRRETGRSLSDGGGCHLRGRCPQYERNRASWPLAYRLSEKA